MVTEVRVESELPGLPELVLNIKDNPDSDLIQVRNIDGLGPAKASVSTSAVGAKSGGQFQGTSVDPRNIVLTLHPNPDWVDWTPETLRNLMDSYFMTQAQVKLYFESEEKFAVGIVGYVESNEPNMFSQDSESQISILCPDPDFIAETTSVVNGLTTDDPIDIEYNGSIPTPVYIKIDYNSAGANSHFDILVRDTFFKLGFPGGPVVTPANYIELLSQPGSKYVKITGTDVLGISGLSESSLLPYILDNSEWPILKRGINSFAIDSDAGVQDWTLHYQERYGSL